MAEAGDFTCWTCRDTSWVSVDGNPSVRCPSCSAPERAENPTSAGTAELLAAHEVYYRSDGVRAIVTCYCGDRLVPKVSSRLATLDDHSAHLAAVLDAHVTERCAQTLEEAADEMLATVVPPGWPSVYRNGYTDGLLVGEKLTRDRAAAVRGERR